MKRYTWYQQTVLSMLLVLTLESTSVVNAVAPPPKEPTIKYELNLPVIGKTVLEGTIDLTTQQYNLATTLKGKRLNLGPLASIGDPTIGLSGDKGLLITAEGRFLNNAARVGIKGLTKDTILLGFDLIKPITIPITPTQKLKITSVDVGLSKTKGPSISAKARLFHTDVFLSIGGAADNPSIKLSIASLKASNIVKEATGKPIDKVELKNLVFDIKNFIKPKPPTPPKPLQITIKGRIDFSKIAFPGMTQNVSNLDMTASLDPEKGFSFEAKLPKSPTIPGIGSIKNATLIVNLNPKKELPAKEKFALILAGSTDFDIPKLGKLALTIAARYEQGKFSFESTIDKPIKFQNIQISNARVKVTQAGTFEILGDSNIKGFDVRARLAITKVKGKPPSVEFEGQLKAGKKLKPFAKTDIPGIKDLTLDQVKLVLAKTAEGMAFVLGGRTTILGTTVDATFETRTIEGKKGIILKAKLPENWSPFAKAPKPLKDIRFTQPRILVSSLEYFDKELKIKVKKGIGFIGGLPMSGAMANINKLFNNKLTDLRVYGTLGTSPKDTALSVPIPIPLPFKTDKIKGGSVVLEISGKPSFALVSNLSVTLTPKDSPLDFTIRLNIEPTQAVGSATMEGLWKNPFGLKGLEIGNVALELGMAYASPGVPTVLGVTGELHIGEKRGKAAVKFSLPDMRDIVIMAAINELGIRDFGDLLKKLGAKIDIKKIPEIGIKNAEFKIAPVGGKIGEITFERGITVKGEINLIKTKGILNINISEKGLIAEGYMNEIKLGKIFKMTGRGPDTKWNTPDDAAIISVALTPQKQHFMISGRIDLLGIKQETDMILSKDGFRFKIESQLGNLFKLLFEAESRGSFRDPDFIIHGTFENKFFKLIEEKAEKEIKKFQEKAKKDIDKAKRNVDKLNKDIAKLSKQINERNVKINNLKIIIKRKTEAAKRKIREAQKKVQQARTNINNINKRIVDEKPKWAAEQIKATQKITNAQNKVRNLDNNIRNVRNKIAAEMRKWYEKSKFKRTLYSAKHGVIMAKLKIELGGIQAARKIALGVLNAVKRVVKIIPPEKSPPVLALIAAKKTAQAGLKVAEGILKAATKVAFDPSSLKEAAQITKIGTEIAGLEIGKKGAIASRETAKGILEAGKQVALGIGEAGKAAAKLLGGPIKIDKAEMRFSLRELIKTGKFPSVTLTVRSIFYKGTRESTFQFDAKNPLKSLESIAQALVKILIGKQK